MKKTLTHLAKVLFVGALLYYLGRRGDLSVESTRNAFGHWRLMGFAFIILILNQLLGALRWQWLLQAHGLRIGYGRVLQLAWIGQFFNVALPGAVSGDFVKAFYVGKEVEGKRPQAFGSILFDRVAGLSALVFVSGMAMAMGFQSFGGDTGSKMFEAIRPLIVLQAVGVVVFYTYLFFVREHHDPVLKGFRKLEAAVPKLHALTKIYLGIRHYHHHRTAVAKVFFLSIFIHCVVGASILCFASALGETGLAPLAVYTVFPLGLLVTAIPVAPAGVGTGHVAFNYLFKLIGSSHGADIFTLFAISNVSLGAIGGLIYLRFKAHAEPLEAAPAHG